MIALTIGLIVVGWRIVAQMAAQSLARSDPEAALVWAADVPGALNQLAQKELLKADGNLDLAREWAQRALRTHPLNARALTLLGLVAEREGDQTKAERLIRISGARTWRDETTAEWLFNAEIRRRDYPAALVYADALLRTRWYLQPKLFPPLAAFTTDPVALKALNSFLATSPSWRSWFLSELSTRLANQARLIEVYAALAGTGNPPTNAELRPYLNRLVKDGNFEQAYQIWQQTLPPEQRGNASYPFNSNFDLAADGLPFNWDLEGVAGADIQIVSSIDGGRKRALLVEFSGARVRFANVKQMMLLPTGDYTFRGRVKTEQLQTARGLWWHIFCANNPTTTLATTDLVSGTTPWTDFTVKFRVPAADCKAQWLQLELPARIDPEFRIEGQVWYQDLRIAPTSAANPH
jgi:tetratricopeptide (TPR) repeat protein